MFAVILHSTGSVYRVCEPKKGIQKPQEIWGSDSSWYCWWLKSCTTGCKLKKKPTNNGINDQPQLVSLPDFWTINSRDVIFLGVQTLQFFGWEKDPPPGNGAKSALPEGWQLAGISPFSIGNTSTQSGSIFQPAILVYRSVYTYKYVYDFMYLWICQERGAKVLRQTFPGL